MSKMQYLSISIFNKTNTHAAFQCHLNSTFPLQKSIDTAPQSPATSPNGKQKEKKKRGAGGGIEPVTPLVPNIAGFTGALSVTIQVAAAAAAVTKEYLVRTCY